MIKVEAIVREEVFEDVKEALNAIDVNGITVSQVMGCGAQRGYKKRVRGTEVDVMMQPKIKFEIVVSSEEWEKATIDAIQKAVQRMTRGIEATGWSDKDIITERYFSLIQNDTVHIGIEIFTNLNVIAIVTIKRLFQQKTFFRLAKQPTDNGLPFSYLRGRQMI